MTMVRFGFGVKRPEPLMTLGGWDNWEKPMNKWHGPQRGKRVCRRREINCLKATMRNEITNTWDIREHTTSSWEGKGGGNSLIDQPKLHLKTEAKWDFSVCLLTCLFLHLLILRQWMMVAAPKSYWPSKAIFGRAFSALLKETLPLVQTKRAYLWSKPLVPFCPESPNY